MKKLFVKPLFIALLLLSGSFFFYSCSKSDSPGIPHDNFQWTYEGITYLAGLDTAYISSQGGSSTIIAGSGSSLSTLGIHLTFKLPSFNTGTYSFDPGGGSIFQYTDANAENLNGVSGVMHITNTNNLLTGDFSGTIMTASAVKPITGTFVNMPVRP